MGTRCDFDVTRTTISQRTEQWAWRGRADGVDADKHQHIARTNFKANSGIFSLFISHFGTRKLCILPCSMFRYRSLCFAQSLSIRELNVSAALNRWHVVKWQHLQTIGIIHTKQLLSQTVCNQIAEHAYTNSRRTFVPSQWTMRRKKEANSWNYPNSSCSARQAPLCYQLRFEFPILPYIRTNWNAVDAHGLVHWNHYRWIRWPRNGWLRFILDFSFFFAFC